MPWERQKGSLFFMRIGSNGVTQVFRAYTKQLRGQYAQADKESNIQQTRARGFEQVNISKEAIALAASQQPEETPEQEKTEKLKKGKEEAAEKGDKAEREDGSDRTDAPASPKTQNK